MPQDRLFVLFIVLLCYRSTIRLAIDSYPGLVHDVIDEMASFPDLLGKP